MAQNGIRSGTIVIVLAGAVLSYAAVKGKGVGDSLRTLIGGGNPADTPDGVGRITGTGVSTASGDSGSGDSSGVSGGLSASAAGNRRIAQVMAASRGWVGNQWLALDQIIMHESGYDSEAVNPSSHAGGIGQANPYTKMPRIAWPKKLGGGGSAVAQIGWMLSYISSRYGDPAHAWAHWQANGWY